jgi:hypothetical protein
MIAHDYIEEDIYSEDLRKQIDDLHIEIHHFCHLTEKLIKALEDFNKEMGDELFKL